jgi:hypothetical protein
MKLDLLQQKLIAVAKANPPSDGVPYAFEKRIIARLGACKVPDAWALWAGALWRAVVPCLAVMVLLGAWALLAPANAPSANLSQQFESTVLAVADQDQPADTIQ